MFIGKSLTWKTMIMEGYRMNLVCRAVPLGRDNMMCSVDIRFHCPSLKPSKMARSPFRPSTFPRKASSTKSWSSRVCSFTVMGRSPAIVNVIFGSLIFPRATCLLEFCKPTTGCAIRSWWASKIGQRHLSRCGRIMAVMKWEMKSCLAWPQACCCRRLTVPARRTVPCQGSVGEFLPAIDKTPFPLPRKR